MFETKKSKVIVSLFKIERLSVSLSSINLYNSSKRIKYNISGVILVFLGGKIKMVFSLRKIFLSEEEIIP